MQQLNIGASSDFILWKEEELQYKFLNYNYGGHEYL